VTKTIYFIFELCISFFLSSCGSTHNIPGKYRSNFAVHGFFVTIVNLNKDLTFGYRMSGDMLFDTSNGHYRVDNKYIVLSHKPFQPDTSEYEKYGKDAVLLSYALSTNRHLISPEKYVIGHNKLFVCDSTNNIVRKQFGYSKRRHYIFFGKHWYKRRYYLNRVD
jgi:hypothetical protein